MPAGNLLQDQQNEVNDTERGRRMNKTAFSNLLATVRLSRSILLVAC